MRARCTFVDARGVRCRATTSFELHHERPFASIRFTEPCSDEVEPASRLGA